VYRLRDEPLMEPSPLWFNRHQDAVRGCVEILWWRLQVEKDEE
jgi:hypothetical protein